MKSWEPLRSCLLNSTANPAQFGWKLAELAVLFSRQILNQWRTFVHTTVVFIKITEAKNDFNPMWSAWWQAYYSTYLLAYLNFPASTMIVLVWYRPKIWGPSKSTNYDSTSSRLFFVSCNPKITLIFQLNCKSVSL